MTRMTKLAEISGNATSVSGRFFNILCQRYTFHFECSWKKNDSRCQICTYSRLCARVFSTNSESFRFPGCRENCLIFVFPRVVGSVFATEIVDSLLKCIENGQSRSRARYRCSPLLTACCRQTSTHRYAEYMYR
jgi:hypothetical protein